MEIICPKPAALVPISAQTCAFRLDQLVRFAFQRTGQAPFATDASIKLLATWTPLLAAADSTKIIMSPLFANAVIPESEGAFTGGNDNTTFNGLRAYQGENFVTITGTFTNVSPQVRADLELLSPESLSSSIGTTNLGLIPINKDGFLFPKALSTIPIYNWRVSSRGSQGLNANDTVAFSFDVPANWDKGLASLKPSFDPLTALVNA